MLWTGLNSKNPPSRPSPSVTCTSTVNDPAAEITSTVAGVTGLTDCSTGPSDSVIVVVVGAPRIEP